LGAGAGSATASGAPDGAKVAARGDRPAVAEKILGALDVEVPQIEAPAGYGVALAGLVAFLVVIGLAYLALLAFLGWLLVWHVFQALASFSHGPYFIFHIPMALLGGLLLLFLIKPVFFRRRGEAEAVITLGEDEEPLFFAFVNKLCDATGARRPAAIEVDCEANASARIHRKGIAGALAGSEYVLRIGLPVAAGMTVPQFAGVLAHELGHFRQRGGMKGSLLIRLMVAFFAKVVFERDRLDEKLARMRGGSGLARAVALPAGWLIELARGVLWLMMVSGELLCCGVLRRMEYDADCLEAHVAGTREFLAVSRLMLFLSIASRRAHADLGDAWEQRRLADDLPRLIVAHARQLAEHRDDILKLLDADKTSWFDTHPCFADRLCNVERTGAKGLVACDVGAKHLFGDFGALCRQASEAFYRSVVGEALEKGALIPTAELVEQRKGERESFKALRRFFRHGPAPTRPILPGPDALEPPTPGGREKLAREVAAAREEMLSLAEVASAASEQYETSNAALVINKAKIALNAILPLKAASRIARETQRDKRLHEPLRLKSIHELVGFENAARRRLTLALRLAQAARPARRVTKMPGQADFGAIPLVGTDQPVPAAAPDGATAGVGDDSRSVEQMVALCRAIEPHLQNVERLRELALHIRCFFGAYDDEQPYPPLVKRLVELGEEAVGLLGRVRSSLNDRPFPFAHARQGITVGRALVEHVPKPNDPVEVHAVSVSAVDRFYDLVYRTLAELTQHAERVERSIGLEPLAELAPKEDKEAAERETAEQRKHTRRYWLGYGGRAAGGVAMVACLVWLSVSPPALPAMGWPSGGGGSGGYRPARFSPSPRGFRTPFRMYAPQPERTSRPNLTPPNPDPRIPSVGDSARTTDRQRPGRPGAPDANPGGRPGRGARNRPGDERPSPGNPNGGARPSPGRPSPGGGGSPGGAGKR
jgi:Zn-dependent protease with chaperone function